MWCQSLVRLLSLSTYAKFLLSQGNQTSRFLQPSTILWHARCTFKASFKVLILWEHWAPIPKPQQSQVLTKQRLWNSLSKSFPFSNILVCIWGNFPRLLQIRQLTRKSRAVALCFWGADAFTKHRQHYDTQVMLSCLIKQALGKETICI